MEFGAVQPDGLGARPFAYPHARHTQQEDPVATVPITRTEADDAVTELVVRELVRLRHEAEAAASSVHLIQHEARYLDTWLRHHRPSRRVSVFAEVGLAGGLGEIDTWAHPAAQLEAAS